MTKNYKTKLKAYSSVLGGLGLMTLAGSNADAQIVYTDNADVTLSYDDDIQIDFNNDATDDVKLYMETTYGDRSYVAQYTYSYDTGRNLYSYGSGTGRLATSAAAPLYADRLDFGAVIDNAKTYDANSQTQIFDVENDDELNWFANMVEKNSPASPWVENSTDKYLGVKFLIETNTHYGWILMSVNSQFTATIKSFAYNSTPDAGLTAGQTITSIFNSKAEAVNVNLFEETLTLEKMTKGGNVTVMNATGNEVFSSNVNAGDNEYKVAGLTPGLYIVNVNLEEKVITKKVMVN